MKSLISGESYSKTARKLADEFGVEKFHATTLIHTEAAHVHAQADLKAYKDVGVREYKYLATLDYRTCETCQPFDGKVFKLSEARPGVNYPTMHPRCRCITTMNIDYTTRTARNPLTGKNEKVDGSLTYEEWKNGLSPEQRDALNLARKKDSRKSKDKLQYKQYQDALGKKNVPKSFDKFQEMKYADPDTWAELKSAYRKVGVDKSGGSDIMNMRGEGMYRKHTEGKIEPMPKKQLNKIVKGFKRQGRGYTIW